MQKMEVVKLLSSIRSNLKLLSKSELEAEGFGPEDGEGSYEDLVLDKTNHDLIGAPKPFLEMLAQLLTGIELDVDPSETIPNAYACPCCGAISLFKDEGEEDEVSYDICVVCRWEDDGTIDILSRSSVNRGTMKEYRNALAENIDNVTKARWGI